MSKMEYGFIDLYGGGPWKDSFVDHYNTLSEEIETKEKAGMNVEWLKDARHKYFVAVAEAYLEAKKAKKKHFRDIETEEEFSIEELRTLFERLRLDKKTESETFEEYMENCSTRHNGTLERI